MLLAIGATERACSWPASGMTVTSRNARKASVWYHATLMLLASNFVGCYVDVSSRL